MRYKLTIAYDGTHYCGWQVQLNGTSIQSVIQKTLIQILRHPLDLTGSSRTDAGVHALGQTAHFDTPQELDAVPFKISLNGLLPLDIRILDVEAVSSTFHSRYSATSKVYHYHLHLDRISDPFHRLYRYHVRSPLDLDLLRKGAARFLGTHDFTSFANLKEHTSAQNPIRTLDRLDLVEQKGGIRLEFQGNGFLYKMVRNITGTLLEVGLGKKAPEEITTILETKDRKRAGPAIAPHGLFLMKIFYP